jgi:hypothetical protein
MEDILKPESDDPKKYFNTKDYATQYLNIDEEAEEPNKEQEDEIASITKLLTDPQYKNVKRETLKKLKEEKKSDKLLIAIAKQEDKELQNKLVGACWESEMNFSKYLPFFILLVLDKDYLVSLEAITVISTMEGPFEDNHIEDGIKKITDIKNKTTDEKVVLYNDLLVALKGFKK